MRYLLPFLLGVSLAFNFSGLKIAGMQFSAGLLLTFIYMLFQINHISLFGAVVKKFGYFVLTPFFVFSLLLLNNFMHAGRADNTILVFLFIIGYFLFLSILVNSYKDESCVDAILTGLSIGATIISLCYIKGIGVVEELEGRFSVFGMNSNVAGTTESLTFIYTLNKYILNFKDKRWLLKLFFLVCLVLQVVFIISTGSRAAFLALSLGLIGSILFLNISAKAKGLFILLSLVLMIFLFRYLVMTDTYVIARLVLTIDEGDISGRDNIWEDFVPYIVSAPLFGVGETGFNAISAKVYGFYWHPHNEIIFLLLTTGVVGTTMMLVFWIKTFILSYMNLKKRREPAAFLLIIPILLAILSQQLLYEKFGWCIYAYMIVSAHHDSLVYKRNRKVVQKNRIDENSSLLCINN